MKNNKLLKMISVFLILTMFAGMAMASSSSSSGSDSDSKTSKTTAQEESKETEEESKDTKEDKDDSSEDAEDDTEDTEDTEKDSEDSGEELTLGSTFEFDNLEITVGDKIKFVKIKNQFSEHKKDKIIKVPLHITNLSDKAHGLNMFYVKGFGSKGTEVDEVGTYFKDGLFESGDIRPGKSQDLSLYFVYDGDGEYFITFEALFDSKEVKIDVKKK